MEDGNYSVKEWKMARMKETWEKREEKEGEKQRGFSALVGKVSQG